MRRRTFLRSATAAAILGPGALRAKATPSARPEAFAAPLLKREALPDPIIIAALSLHERDGHWLVRARDTEGHEGWAVSHNRQMPLFFPIFLRTVAPFFEGKDVRELDTLVDDVFTQGSVYKMQGQGFWVPVASAEFAILDLVGRRCGLPVADLLGQRRRSALPLYVANNHRAHGPEESLRRIVASVERTGAKALKIKVGGRMQRIDSIPGRTEALVPLVARELGDRCTLYADANGSYTDVPTAVRIGRLLENHGFAFYEEPCPFDWLEETRAVAEALTIPIAGGEQESSQWRFRWMIREGAVQIPQPDLFYYGGLIRAARVARFAHACGLPCTPHISGVGMGFLYMAIFASMIDDPGPFQEFKGLPDDLPWETTGSPLALRNGVLTTPDGPGLGVRFDPAWLAGAREISL